MMDLITYEILKNDTLEIISRKYNISVKELVSFHNENSPITRNIHGDHLPAHLSYLFVNPVLKDEKDDSIVTGNDYKVISDSEFHNFKKLLYTTKTESIFNISTKVKNQYTVFQKSKKLECSSPHYDSYLILLSLLDRPFEKLVLEVTTYGEIIKIKNQVDIKQEWEAVKEELKQMTSDQALLEQIITGSSDIYTDSLHHVKANLLYNLFFPQLFKDHSAPENIIKSYPLNLYSSLFTGNKILLNMHNLKTESDRDDIYIKSKSFLETENDDRVKDLYNRTYKELLGNSLEYNFSLRSERSLNKNGILKNCDAYFIENINDTMVSKSNYRITKI